MSYDLFFYKRKTDPITKSEIETYLNTLPNLEGNAENQWFFQNKESGAYWTFEYYPSDGNDTDDVEYDEGFEDFEDTNFMFNINFVRPNFFGYEAFPIAEKLAEDLNLLIFNPQGDAIPKNYNKGAFEKEWIEANIRYAKNYFDDWGLNYLEENSSDYSWRHNLHRAELQNQYGNEYFVPKIFYVKKHDSRIVETLCVWPEHIPYILPKVDIVLVQKKIPKLFCSKKEEGLVRYSELIEQLGTYFLQEENYLVLNPNEADKISKTFNRLKVFGSFDTYGEGVSLDKFVNGKPNIDLL